MAHIGRLVLFALQELALDEFWWLVSPGNPLKEGAKDMAPLHARLASAHSKMARRCTIQPTAIEKQLGTRYTYNTLRALVRRVSQTAICLDHGRG